MVRRDALYGSLPIDEPSSYVSGHLERSIRVCSFNRGMSVLIGSVIRGLSYGLSSRPWWLSEGRLTTDMEKGAKKFAETKSKPASLLVYFL